MYTRQTSLEAYDYIISTGVIGKRQRQVYKALYIYGPMTANETYEVLSRQRGKSLRFDSNTHARFTELREMGIAQELGTRTCKITGRNCILWDVTAHYPRKRSKRNSLSLKQKLAIAKEALTYYSNLDLFEGHIAREALEKITTQKDPDHE